MWSLLNRARREGGSGSTTRERLIPPSMAPLSIRDLPSSSSSPMVGSVAPLTTRTRRGDLPESIKAYIQNVEETFPAQYKHVRNVFDALKSDPEYQQAKLNMSLHARSRNVDQVVVREGGYYGGGVDYHYYRSKGHPAEWIRHLQQLHKEFQVHSDILEPAQATFDNMMAEYKLIKKEYARIRNKYNIDLPDVQLPKDLRMNEQEAANVRATIEDIRSMAGAETMADLRRIVSSASS